MRLLMCLVELDFSIPVNPSRHSKCTSFGRKKKKTNVYRKARHDTIGKGVLINCLQTNTAVLEEGNSCFTLP